MANGLDSAKRLNAQIRERQREALARESERIAEYRTNGPCARVDEETADLEAQEQERQMRSVGNEYTDQDGIDG